MCQKVSGPTEILKVRYAYKVLKLGRNHLFYPTRWNKKTNWAMSSTPKKIKGYDFDETCFGYHVFKTKAGAEHYKNILYMTWVIRVVKVKIKGKALPFTCDRYQGWAVTTWKRL